MPLCISPLNLWKNHQNKQKLHRCSHPHRLHLLHPGKFPQIDLSFGRSHEISRKQTGKLHQIWQSLEHEVIIAENLGRSGRCQRWSQTNLKAKQRHLLTDLRSRPSLWTADETPTWTFSDKRVPSSQSLSLHANVSLRPSQCILLHDFMHSTPDR